MRKFSIGLILGGAALTALSILFFNLGGDVLGTGYVLIASGIALLAAGILILIGISKKTGHKLIPDGASYSKKDSLLSAPEYDFLCLLRGIVDLKRCEILPQISLNAVITKHNASYRNELFRLADFCIADSATFEPLLLIELNDKSHERDDRRLRDEKVRAICDAAKMPIVSFTLEEATDPRFVAGRIRRYVRVR